jgi:hypothetical protein
MHVLLLVLLFSLLPQTAHAHGGVGAPALLLLVAGLPVGLVVGTAFYFLVARRLSPTLKTWAGCVFFTAVLTSVGVMNACEELSHPPVPEEQSAPPGSQDLDPRPPIESESE